MWLRSDYSGLGKLEGPLVAISLNSFKAASPCLSLHYLLLHPLHLHPLLLHPHLHNRVAFPPVTSNSNMSRTPATLQKCSLMPLIHHWRMSLHLFHSISTSILNRASRHFLKIVDSLCPFLRNQVLWDTWIGKGRYPETRNSGKCWFPGYSGVIAKHDGKTENWVLPMLLSLGLVPINRVTRHYS